MVNGIEILLFKGKRKARFGGLAYAPNTQEAQQEDEVTILV
jgi:hypothetical protein